MTDKKTIAFLTLGCAKNEVDSDHMMANLVSAGFAVCEFDFLRKDICAIVINTCAFLKFAVEENLDVILDCAQYIKDNFDEGSRPKLVVCGCLPSRYMDDLKIELPEVDLFLSVADEINLALELKKFFKVEHSGEFSCIRTSSSTFAYVKIADGCSKFCSYCMIPYIRGKYDSYSLNNIDLEVAELVANGVKEIVLVAQDSGLWGLDLKEENSKVQNLAMLLEILAEKYPSIWFRVLYVQPSSINDELLRVIAKHNNIASYIDMPLQHASADILKKMNRCGDSLEFLQQISHIRKIIPDVTIRSTFMCGFPGETEDDFAQLCDFIQDAQLDYAGTFSFSAEDKTKAYLLPNQIDEDEKLYRHQQLYDLCESIGFSKIAERVGQEADVLIEGVEQTDAGLEFVGRAMFQAPDVDGLVHIANDKNSSTSFEKLDIGNIVRVKFVDSFCYELEGVLT